MLTPCARPCSARGASPYTAAAMVMKKIDEFFKLSERKTSFKTELLAGTATFMTCVSLAKSVERNSFCLWLLALPHRSR